MGRFNGDIIWTCPEFMIPHNSGWINVWIVIQRIGRDKSNRKRLFCAFSINFGEDRCRFERKINADLWSYGHNQTTKDKRQCNHLLGTAIHHQFMIIIMTNMAHWLWNRQGIPFSKCCIAGIWWTRLKRCQTEPGNQCSNMKRGSSNYGCWSWVRSADWILWIGNWIRSP